MSAEAVEKLAKARAYVKANEDKFIEHRGKLSAEAQGPAKQIEALKSGLSDSIKKEMEEHRNEFAKKAGFACP